MIMAAGLGMVYLAIVSWSVVRNGLDRYLSSVGRNAMISIGLSLVFGLHILVFSTHRITIMQPGDSQALGETITLGTFNKLYDSENYVRDTDFLLASRIDILSLQEVDEEEVQYVSQLLGHEYTVVTDCGCSAYGTEVAIVSKFPILYAETIYEHDNSVILRSQIEHDYYGEIVVYTVHMHVPNSPESLRLRGEAFEALTRGIQSELVPVFAMGDFNTTIFSPQMHDFRVAVGESVTGVYERRWPRCSWYGYSEAGCIRIDHIFVPAQARVGSHEIGQENFSDHRPVVVEVAI